MPFDNVQPSSSRDVRRHELPRIPVAMRHPYLVTSVKQYRSNYQQTELRQHIVSESFIPVVPYSNEHQPRKRRRPPFSCAALIIQALSTSETGQMTLQGIYKWIIDKYPSLYNAEDTGWQNTIRHNLSLNKCFRKIPKDHGKGGYWTLDPNYLPVQSKQKVQGDDIVVPRPVRQCPTPSETTASSSSTSAAHVMQIKSILN